MKVFNKYIMPATVILILLGLLIISTSCNQMTTASSTTNPAASITPSNTSPVQTVIISPLTPIPTISSTPIPEPTTVPQKIIVYTDFECGGCERWHSIVEPELNKLYVATGQAQIEIRLLGVMGTDSIRAASAALYAGDHGLFKEYSNALFKNWVENDVEAYSIERLIETATSLGLDGAGLGECLESGAKEAELKKNLELAQADKVRTLPAVLAGNARVEGNRTLDAYTNLIDAEIGKMKEMESK